MDKRMVSFAQGRVVAIALAGVLVALGILCLAVLASAQAPPAGQEETTTPHMVFTAAPPTSTQETATPDLVPPTASPTGTQETATPDLVPPTASPTVTQETATPDLVPPAASPTGTQVTPAPEMVLPEIAPVSVKKTVSPGTIYQGDTVRYTVLFTNTTVSPVNLDRISDTLPTDFTFLSMAAASDIDDLPVGTTGTIVWNSGPYPVPASGTLRLIYNVKVNAPPSLTPYMNQLKALLGGGTVIGSSAPVNVVGANLSGSKSASSGQVPKGSMVLYTVTFNNGGTATANLSVVTDTLPAPFVFRQMVSGPLPRPTIQGRNLIWAGPISIPPGGQLQFSYQVTVGGAINQTYANSARAELNDGIVGPYQASVKVLQPKVYLPLIIKISGGPVVVYRLAYDYKPSDSGQFEVWAIDADGTDPVNVSNETGGDSDPTWSPDGTKIAWVHYYSDKGDIITADADGSSKVNLTNNSVDDRAPDWSPDGTKIVFHSYRDDRWEVYVMDANGANVRKLTTQSCQSHDALWSPDGTKIGFICGLNQYAEVYVMNADGSGQTRLTEDSTSEWREDKALSWSPDSTRLAFAKYYNKNNDKGNIYVVNVGTKAITQLTSKDTASHSPQWSPEGTKIAFSTYIGDNYEIATMSPDGTNIVNLTNAAKGDFVPRWSADGLKLSFISNRSDGKELYTMNADGSGQLRLTTRTATGSDITSHEWHP